MTTLPNNSKPFSSDPRLHCLQRGIPTDKEKNAGSKEGPRRKSLPRIAKRKTKIPPVESANKLPMTVKASDGKPFAGRSPEEVDCALRNLRNISS